MPSEPEEADSTAYSGLTKIRTGDEAADSTDRTVRKATPYWFKFNLL
ncbi:hypothetical protein [Neisseria meningitidis]|nr:hypothetical protein [Neisseria meningitidis]